MKLTRYGLRMLIESIINENEADVTQFSDYDGGAEQAVLTFDPSQVKAPAKDNSKARELEKSNADAALKLLNIKVKDGRYFVYSKEGEKMSLGDVRYSKGDPYTYKAVGGGYYRVMSGPDSDEERDNGKRVGTTPIGAKFKPGKAPNVTVVDPSAVLSKLKSTLAGYEDDAKNGMSYLLGINQDRYQELEDYFNTSRRSRDVTGNTGPEILYRLMSQASNVSSPAASTNRKIINNYLNSVNDKLKLARGKIDLKPVSYVRSTERDAYKDDPNVNVKDITQPGGGQAELKESFSRGSLLRRRYRRY